MRPRLVTPVLIILAVLVLCGFNGPSPEERQAQNELPMAHDQVWQVLGRSKIVYSENQQRFKASFPAEVKALAGRSVTITGFILPLEPTEKFRHFILSKRTPTCGFSLPGGPDEIIEVWLAKPTVWEEGLVKVTGTFELINGQEMGMFFKLNDAKKQ
jgi:hypothetical protein